MAWLKNVRYATQKGKSERISVTGRKIRNIIIICLQGVWQGFIRNKATLDDLNELADLIQKTKRHHFRMMSFVLVGAFLFLLTS